MSRAKRAKKSIIPKLFLIMLLLAGTAFGIVNYKPEIQEGIASVKDSIGIADVKTYEANDYINDYVKAIFTDTDGTRYIPIVYEKYDKQITASDIRAKFAEYGIELKEVPNNIVNGSTVKTEKATYKVLIYGDTNCDGKVNVLDAQKIVLHVVNNGNGSNALTGIKALAANVQDTNKTDINVRDAMRIVDFVLSNNTIIGSLPASDVSKDKKAPTITLNGDSRVTIVKGREYIELGATVTDDTDPNVKVEIIYPETIDTNIVKEYTVIYKSKDLSGKESEVTRTVIVEEENVPNIIFDDESLGDNIAVNIASDVDNPADEAVIYFNELKTKLGATATDEKGNRLNVTVTGIEDVDLSKPGKYTITYVSDENAQGIRGRRTRIIEVVDRVYMIALKDNSTENYVFNEGDKIRLDRLTATIYRVSENHEYDVPVTRFGTGDYKDFTLEITEAASGNTPITVASYIGLNDASDPLNDETTANRVLTAKAIWTNPAPTSIESYKEVTNTLDNAGRMTVIGNIRAILDDTSFNTPDMIGDKYSLLEIARLTTKNYQQNLTANNLKIDKITVNDENNVKIPADSSVVNARLDFDNASGIVSVKFWASEIGTYNITVKSESIIDGVKTTLTKEIAGIRVTASEKVDLIKPVYVDTQGTKLYDGILKVNGEAKEFELKFEHTYGSRDTAIVTEPVNVKAGKVTVDFSPDDSGMSHELITDSNGYVTGVRIIPPKTLVVPDTSYIEKNMIIHVDSSIGVNNKEISKEENIKIYPESKYSVSYDTEDITLYLKDTGANLTYRDGNTVYTLVPATLKDQYSNVNSTVYPYDPSVKSIKAERLSTDDNNLNVDGSVILRDGATMSDGTHTFIQIAGFSNENTKVQSGDIKYIGIALKDNGLGDEDKKVEAAPYIFTYYVSGTSSETTNLNIENIVKKDITTFNVTTSKTKDYCYENSIVANISTGPWEEDLLDVNSVSLTVSGTASGATATKELNTITVDGESKPDGTLNIRLNAPYAGNYTITATLNEKRGNTWVPTNKTGITETIKITDNPVITSVAFSYAENYKTSSGEIAQRTPTITKTCINGGTTQFGGTPTNAGANKNGSVRLGKTEMHTIVYYHDYYNGSTLVERRKIEDTDIMPSNQSVTISNDIKLWSEDKTSSTTLTSATNTLVISKATGGTSIPDTDTTSYVDGIAVRYSNADLLNKYLTFDITIDQTKYGAGMFTFTVGVNTTRQATIDDIRLESLNNNGTYNLYVDTATAAQNGDTIYTEAGRNYTVFKIYYLDEDYDQVPILASNIANNQTNSGDRVVWLIDDLAMYNQALVNIVTLSKNSNTGAYKVDTANNVMYVGIAPQKHPFYNKYSSKLSIYLNSGLEHTVDLKVITGNEDNTTQSVTTSKDKVINETDADNKVNSSDNNGATDNKVDTSTNLGENNTITNVPDIKDDNDIKQDDTIVEKPEDKNEVENNVTETEDVVNNKQQDNEDKDSENIAE